MARHGDNGRVVQQTQPSSFKPGKPSGTSSPADGQDRAPRQPKKGRNNPTKAERRNARGAASSQTLQNESSPGQQQIGNDSNNNDRFDSGDAIFASRAAPGAPKRGVGYRRGGGRGRGSARKNTVPQHPNSAQAEPRPSDDLIELLEDSPGIAPGHTASSRPGPDPPSSKPSASRAHAATSGSRKKGHRRGSGNQLPPKARQNGSTAAATAPIKRRDDPELSIPKASDIRAAGLIEDSEDESEEEEAAPVDGAVDEAAEAAEADSFYRSIDKTYREARTQRTCEFPLQNVLMMIGLTPL